MKHIMQVWRDDGVPGNVPLLVTKSHLANELTGPMTTIFAALWLTDNVGSFSTAAAPLFIIRQFSLRIFTTHARVGRHGRIS